VLEAALDRNHADHEFSRSVARTRLLPAILLVYAISFRLVTLARPFQYDDEATGGAFYGLLARNYLRIPWGDTHGIPVLTVGRLPGVRLAFYPDHPPLVPLLIAPLYRLLGAGEWQARLPTSIATVLSVFVLYRLIRRSASERAAVTAAALFAAMPMVLHFGGQPEVLGMPLVLCALLTVDGYLRLCRDPGWAALARAAAPFTVAAASDWPAFILMPVFAVHFVATEPRRRWRWMLAFGAWAVALFATLYVYIAVAAHLRWDWMLPLLKGRTAIGVKSPFTAAEWLRTAWYFNLHCHTAPLMAAAVAWPIARALPAGRRQEGSAAAGLLLAWGALHVLIGRQGVYNHEWWWWPLTPGIASAAALLAESVVAAAGSRASSRSSIVVAVAVSLFAVWTTIREYRHLYPPPQAGVFTTLEIGAAIQAAAPGPDDLAMVAWSGEDPELWFYGDRPLRTNVWSVDEFVARLSGTDADLAFGYLQPWPARAAGLVFPMIAIGSMPDLHAYLQARYPHVPLTPTLARQFEVFDLR